MIEMILVQTDEHKQHVRELYFEYMEYVRWMIFPEFGIEIEVAP